MSDIFISYASLDRDRVRPLVNALQKTGWSVFWDRNIPTGKTWRHVIGDELSGARSIIVVWSEKSVESDWVQEEAEEGKRRDILFPVFLDQVVPPFGFGNIQAADLVGWDGSPEPTRLDRLISDLSRVLGPQPSLEVARKREQAEAQRVEEERGRAEAEAKREAEQEARGRAEVQAQRKADEARLEREAKDKAKEEERKRAKAEAKRTPIPGPPPQLSPGQTFRDKPEIGSGHGVVEICLSGTGRGQLVLSNAGPFALFVDGVPVGELAIGEHANAFKVLAGRHILQAAITPRSTTRMDGEIIARTKPALHARRGPDGRSYVQSEPIPFELKGGQTIRFEVSVDRSRTGVERCILQAPRPPVRP